MMVPEPGKAYPVLKPLHLSCVLQFEVKTSTAIASVGLSWVFLCHWLVFFGKPW